MKIGVIGAGIGGIAAAIRLANKGHNLDVFESNPYPGGKLSEINLDGYRFDAGPSLFTMPQKVDELFKLSGKNPRDYFSYERLSIICKYFYEDGTIINAYSDRDRFVAELLQKTSVKESDLIKLLDKSAFLYDSLATLFIDSSLNKWGTYLNKSAFKAYLRIPGLGFFDTLNGANQALLKDPKVTQLFNRYATYNGSDPYRTPATMNIIPHLEYAFGAYFPGDGMYSITKSLYNLAKDLGVKFYFNRPVTSILLDGKAVSGLELSGLKVFYDSVVTNMDMNLVYKKLLPKRFTPKKLTNQPKSSSALIFYWGINTTFPELELHNIFFARDYKEEFDAIFNNNTITNDPTVYINISSKLNHRDAPKGKENWFVMINAPNDQGQDWQSLISKAKANIILKLNRILKVDLNQLIEAEDILDPAKIHKRTSSMNGALYGNSSNNKMAAFLRHPNATRRIRNLYFCGGSVHPGGGIPLSLSSAKLVADEF